jgi:N-carbamoyl-L-amino-acid hydrolase
LNRWLAEFSRFGGREDGGVDRVAFSDADMEGRAWVLALLEEAGLDVTVDVAGNLLGRRPGSEVGLSPLMLGSHIDSVPAGGNYDGPLGSLGAIEVVRSLHEAGVKTRHPLVVVVFVNEEGGKTGSRILAGEFQARELELETASGYTIGEGIRRLGGDPDRLAEARREVGDVAGYLELHVEQGGILEGEEITIGVVEGIVGIRRWTATVFGAANHAGTTPMDQRRDALMGAARLVEAVNRAVRALPGSQVGTVGQIQARPGAPNVIPGEVVMSIELRALAMETIERVMERIREEAEVIGRENGTPISIEEFYRSGAAPTDERFREWVEASAEDLLLSHRRMPSGAGHDAQSVAHFAPMGMIFIPSVGGLSHHPDEYSRPEDIEAGANVLLGALLRADQGLDPGV